MLRLGIIGCGKVTTMFHLKSIKEVEDVTVTAVADLNQKRMENVRRKAGALKGYTSPEELLTDPDIEVVAINTPPRFHETLVLKAIEAGKHALCEKPLAQTLEGCKRIGEAQTNTGLVVLPVHNYAFTPCLITARDLIEKGEIGALQEIDVKFNNNLWSYGSKTDFRTKVANGLVEDILPHALSVVQVLSDPVSEVAEAEGWMRKYQVLDNIRLIMATGSGVTVRGEMNWTSLIPGFKVKVSGDEGTIHIDLMKAPQGGTVKTERGSKRIGGMNLGQYLDLILLKHPAFVGQYEHLVSTVRGDAEPLFTVDDEILMMDVLEDVVRILSNDEKGEKK
ncbi:MAG: Gfo/Idh/MocA family oxidoreductase [Candidatus Bathyarchaeota archaeon]|jgi:predicted dehydrogenase|nr:Gfo/Idh/MocA family oxidoreductase [Candidatus Bathyarchaeota archaeon]